MKQKKYWKILIGLGCALILIAIVELISVSMNYGTLLPAEKKNLRWGSYGFIFVGLYLINKGFKRKGELERPAKIEAIRQIYRDGDLVGAIKTLIEEQCGINRDEIKIESRIEDDLGITGDDGPELLLEFAEIFDVDVSNFMGADYFEGEGNNLLNRDYNPDKKVLTIAHLEKAVIAGKLDDSVIHRV